MGQRNGQRVAMKAKRHEERKRSRRVQRDMDRARDTVGAELMEVRQVLAQRDLAAAEPVGDIDPGVLARLRREHSELREDLAHALDVSAQLRRDLVEERRLSNELTDEVEQYQDIASRMKIKSEAMFTVFAHWDILAGWRYEETQGQAGSPQEQTLMDFWRWMHQQQAHLFPDGYIETSYEEELAVSEVGG